MDFEKVLSTSEQKPVVIDFWAPWCGPCKFLGPVIEQLATEADGTWELVKINSDEHQELAQQYHVRGIPAVKMLFKREVIAEFTGALPKHQIEAWLEEHLPDDRKEQLKDLVSGSEAELRTFVENNPDFLAGKVALARKVGVKDPAQALELVQDVPPSNPAFGLELQLKDRLLLDKFEGGADKEKDEAFAVVREKLANEDTEHAVSDLIDLVIKDKSYADELARKTLVAIFGILEPEHPITKQFRKKFDMALY